MTSDRISRDDYARLNELPHGTRVWAGAHLLTIDSESIRFCLRDESDCSYTYPHHVHEEYGVAFVTVEAPIAYPAR